MERAHLALTWPAALIAFAVLIHLPGLADPLTETHAFRQTQTAFPAVMYASGGIDLLRPQVPVLGEPYVLPFEFPIVQAIGAALITAGLSAEIAMRGLGLVSFAGTAWLLWALLARHASPRAGLIAVAAFVLSPLALVFSRTSLIEYPATFAALAFVYAALAWHTTGQRRWLPIALLTGSVAALIKIPTAVFWVAPVLLTRRGLAVVLAAVPALVGLAWTRYADAVKAANPYSAFLSSDQLLGWTLGGDRLSLATWAAALTPTLLSAGMILLPFAVLVIWRRERLLWAWMGIALAGPLLAFTNLYAIHDYYSIAIAPAAAALIGGGLDAALERSPRIIGAVAAGLVVIAFSATTYLWPAGFKSFDPEGVLARAAEIRAASRPDDVVTTYATDWSPAPYFYAGRRGVVLQADVAAAWNLAPPTGSVVVP